MLSLADVLFSIIIRFIVKACLIMMGNVNTIIIVLVTAYGLEVSWKLQQLINSKFIAFFGLNYMHLNHNSRPRHSDQEHKNYRVLDNMSSG